MKWEEPTARAEGRGSGDLVPRRASLVCLAGAQIGESFVVERARTVIGRSQRADVRLMDEGVSRDHAVIVAEGEQFFVEDLGSKNGTFVNGDRVQRCALKEGDKILIGVVGVLKFTFQDPIDEAFQREMYESALRDRLTKAFNRKYFMDRLQAEYAYAVRHRVPLSLALLDVDHFKDINDRHGHPVGDSVLEQLAGVVMETVRTEDAFARVGGEEFAILARGSDGDQSLIMAERVRKAIEAHPFLVSGIRLQVTVSLGLATLTFPPFDDPSALVNAADQALYRAKGEGRNRIVVAAPGG